LETEVVAAAGATLKSHWQTKTALRAIRETRWDFVVLQEQSGMPLQDTNTMHLYARLFDAEIKKVHAKTVFFLTWSRKAKPETQASITEAYKAIASELNAEVAPVGVAWQNVNSKKAATLYNLDGSHPSPLGSYLAACVFYAVFYQKSPLGLSPAVYSTQFDQGRNGDLKLVGKLGNEDARFIQTMAWQTVTNFSLQKDSRE